MRILLSSANFCNSPYVVYPLGIGVLASLPIPRLSRADALGTLIEKLLSPDINLSPLPMLNADGSVAISSPPKEVREFNGRRMVLETGIEADVALVRAAVADRHGNLRFHAAAQNFNPPAAMSGRLTIVEAEKVVEPGELDPADVHVAGVFVDRVVALTPEQAQFKMIEKRTTTPRPGTDEEA